MTSSLFDRIDCKSHGAWLEARKNGIGGSDAACIIGMNPWKSNSELWEEKVGLRQSEDISDKPAVRYGTEAEEPLRQLFILDHPEYTVHHKEFEILRSKEYPFLFASVDGELTDRDGKKGILEIKTTSIMNANMLENWNNRVPDNYYIQCLHYLIVTGYDFVKLKAQLRFPYGEELKLETRHYTILRKSALEDIQTLLSAEIAFWRQVERRERPGLKLPTI